VIRSAPGLVIGAAAATALIAGVAGLPLAWDGSYFLFVVLNDQAPLLIAHRFIETLLTSPVLFASGRTEDLAVLRAIFGVSYTAIPLVALFCSWLVVRRRPELFVWPVLGIAVALLPGRALFIAESLIAAQLAWPLLLAAVVPVSGGVLLLCLALGAIVAVSHPVAAIPLVIVALVGAAIRRRSRRSSASWAAAFLGLAALNLAILGSRLNAFERESLELSVAVGSLIRGALGPQLAAMLLTALAAVLVLRGAHAQQRADQVRAEALALTSIALAAAALLVWAAVPQFWKGEIDFRSWALPITLPLFALAILDACSVRGRPLQTLVDGRMRIARAAAVAMFLVMLVQSVVWVQLTSRVSLAVEGAHGCIDAASIEGFPDSPLGHWSITPLSMLLQARDVRSFVGTADACRATRWPSEVTFEGATARPGWFRFH